MLPEVARSAEPVDRQRPVVIVMVHLGVRRFADFAGRALDLAAIAVDVRVAASVGSSARFLAEFGVPAAVCAHPGSMAIDAVSGVFAARTERFSAP